MVSHGMSACVVLLGRWARGRKRPARPVQVCFSRPAPGFRTSGVVDHQRAVGGARCLWGIRGPSVPREAPSPSLTRSRTTPLRVRRVESFCRGAQGSLPKITTALGTEMAALRMTEESKALFHSSPTFPVRAHFLLLVSPIGFCLRPARTFRAPSSLSRGPWGMGSAEGRVRGASKPPTVGESTPVTRSAEPLLHRGLFEGAREVSQVSYKNRGQWVEGCSHIGEGSWVSFSGFRAAKATWG